MDDHGLGLGTARRIVFAIFGVQMIVMVATGTWLAFHYRPSPASVWPSLGRLRYGGWSPAIRATHRLVAFSMVPSSVCAAAIVVVDSMMKGPGWRVNRLAVTSGLVLTPLVLLAGFTGYLLPWNQLALWAVTVGTNVSGYRPVFSPSVRFVLIGGSEVGKATLWRWFIVHTVVVSALVLVALALSWRSHRRPDSVAAPSEVTT